jgi:hypothetical protein
MLINHTSILKNKREKETEKDEERRTTKTEQKIRYFLFYHLSFAWFSPLSFIIFFFVLPVICKREQYAFFFFLFFCGCLSPSPKF